MEPEYGFPWRELLPKVEPSCVRVVMGREAWRRIRENVGLLVIPDNSMPRDVFALIGVPVQEQPELAPEDVFAIYSDGSVRRLAGENAPYCPRTNKTPSP